jgi:hypothetical protein
MRTTFAIPLILAFGLAGAAAAQPSTPSADNHAQTISTAGSPQKTEATPDQPRSQAENPEAAAALLIAIRHREDLERMTKIACAAGDTSKCQAPKASDAARSPSP